MLKKELAAALGISPAMVTKLAKRGMPTDSLERAQRWRRRHLEPGRVKGVRRERHAVDPVTHANALAELCLADPERHLPELRRALGLVPQERSTELLIYPEVWEELLGAATWYSLWPEDDEDGAPDVPVGPLGGWLLLGLSTGRLAI